MKLRSSLLALTSQTANIGRCLSQPILRELRSGAECGIPSPVPRTLSHASKKHRRTSGWLQSLSLAPCGRECQGGAGIYACVKRRVKKFPHACGPRAAEGSSSDRGLVAWGGAQRKENSSGAKAQSHRSSYRRPNHPSPATPAGLGTPRWVPAQPSSNHVLVAGPLAGAALGCKLRNFARASVRRRMRDSRALFSGTCHMPSKTQR